MSRCATRRSAGPVKSNARIFILTLLLVMAATVGVRAADKSDSTGHLWMNCVGEPAGRDHGGRDDGVSATRVGCRNGAR